MMENENPVEIHQHMAGSLASTPPGMPGTHPHQYFGWGTSMGISPNIITYFWI